MVALEICIDTLSSAVSAATGGADRLELCSALSEGGLTPTASFLRIVKSLVNIPVFCMVRPRSGSMIYNKQEEEIILGDVEDLKLAGADGIVFGALSADGKQVNVDLCKRVISAANPLPCTFHRAFDYVSDPLAELAIIADLGFTRILTSGAQKTAVEGCDLVTKLVKTSENRITIMAGAGLNSRNCLELLVLSGVKEVHASARKQITRDRATNKLKMGVSDDINYETDLEEVAALKSVISSFYNY